MRLKISKTEASYLFWIATWPIILATQNTSVAHVFTLVEFTW